MNTKISIPLMIGWMALSAAPLAARQGLELRVQGVILNEEDGQTLSDVMVLVPGTSLVGRSTREGFFILRGLDPGEHFLELRKPGFAARSFRFTVTPEMQGVVDVGVVGLRPVVTRAVTLSGSVASAGEAAPIPGVRIAVNDTYATVSDTLGTFSLDSVPLFVNDVNTIEFQRIGYAPLESEFRLGDEGDAVDMSVDLQPLPVQLEDVVVDGEEVIPATGKLRGFFERRATGEGRYLAPWEIEQLPKLKATDLLRGIRGVIVVPGAMNSTIRLTRASPMCQGGQPLIYLDNSRFDVASLDMLDPEAVAAIEVYNGPAETPIEYTGPDAVCGVVLIWTR